MMKYWVKNVQKQLPATIKEYHGGVWESMGEYNGAWWNMGEYDGAGGV